MPLSHTMKKLLEQNADLHSNNCAYRTEDRTITHGELLDRARRAGSALQRVGVRHQDRVGILSMNSIEFGEVVAACQYAGFILATVNFRLAPPEMAYIIKESEPRVLIFEAQYLPVIEALRAELSFVETYVCIGGSADWAIEYEAFVATGDPTDQLPDTDADDIAMLLFTGGTTGRPKGVIWGQRETRNMAHAINTEQQSAVTDLGLIVMPMFHIGALAIIFGLHFRGGSVFLHRQFDPAALLETVERHRITLLHLAPTLVQMILELPRIDQADTSSLRKIVYSAAAMPVPVLRRGLELFGSIFTNLYGQTEVMGTGLPCELHRPDGDERERGWLGSVGYPYANTEVRIVDEDGNDCPRGTAGEIVVRSSVMARGYWNNHIATLNTFRQGWCHSGDIGRIDEDGLLYLVDRKKDMIVSGGENIYSREVEDALLSHPAVVECAVIGVPDEKWGETVCAAVVFRQGKSATFDELVEHCKRMIASYKKPKVIHFLDELPKFPTGKINKLALRERYCK